MNDHDHMLIVVEVKRTTRRRLRFARITSAARTWVNVHGKTTSVWVRTRNGIPDAVVLLLNKCLPDPHHKEIRYIPAREFLQREQIKKGG